MIAATRLHRGNTASAHGAPRLIAEGLTIAKKPGATGTVTVRTDSAYYNRNAEVAVISYTAFTSRKRAEHVAARAEDLHVEKPGGPAALARPKPETTGWTPIRTPKNPRRWIQVQGSCTARTEQTRPRSPGACHSRWYGR